MLHYLWITPIRMYETYVILDGTTVHIFFRVGCHMCEMLLYMESHCIGYRNCVASNIGLPSHQISDFHLIKYRNSTSSDIRQLWHDMSDVLETDSLVFRSQEYCSGGTEWLSKTISYTHIYISIGIVNETCSEAAQVWITSISVHLYGCAYTRWDLCSMHTARLSWIHSHKAYLLQPLTGCTALSQSCSMHCMLSDPLNLRAMPRRSCGPPRACGGIVGGWGNLSTDVCYCIYVRRCVGCSITLYMYWPSL